MTVIDPSITDAMREEAANWLIQLDEETSSEQQDAFQHWLNQDQRHNLVFSQMQNLWSAAQAPKKTNRLSQHLAITGLFLVATLFSLQLPWQYWQADYRTEIGKVQAITLPDGSVATLNTNSAIDVDFSHNQRRINLIRGEVLLDVSKDPRRPFVLATNKVNAKALGTIYSVAQHDNTSFVTVYESQVRVSSTSSQHSTLLNAGQQAVVDDSGIVKRDLKLASNPDWARQRLIFQNAPLKEVIARLQLYHSGMIKLSGDTTAHQRRFTGVLPSDDTEAAIKLLSSSMGLDVHSMTSWLTYLKPSAKP